jgi:hypothetical protein
LRKSSVTYFRITFFVALSPVLIATCRSAWLAAAGKITLITSARNDSSFSSPTGSRIAATTPAIIPSILRIDAASTSAAGNIVSGDEAIPVTAPVATPQFRAFLIATRAKSSRDRPGCCAISVSAIFRHACLSGTTCNTSSFNLSSMHNSPVQPILRDTGSPFHDLFPLSFRLPTSFRYFRSRAVPITHEPRPQSPINRK